MTNHTRTPNNNGQLHSNRKGHHRFIPVARDRKIAPSHPDAASFRHQHGESIPIKLLGCWDTVGELGVPNLIPFVSNWIDAEYQFYDTQLNRQIEFALHAVAIDERRKVFNLTPMTLNSRTNNDYSNSCRLETQEFVGYFTQVS